MTAAKSPRRRRGAGASGRERRSGGHASASAFSSTSRPSVSSASVIDERHERADDVAVGAGADEEEPRLVGLPDDAVGAVLVGLLRAAVLDELERPHGAEAPRVADEREAVDESAEAPLDLGPDRRSPARGAGAARSKSDGRQGRGAGDRVAGVGAAEPADLRAVHDLGAAGDGGDRQPAAERLGHRHDVGLEVVVLGREHPPGPSESRLDLVDDEQDPVLAAEPGEEARPNRAARR